MTTRTLNESRPREPVSRVPRPQLPEACFVPAEQRDARYYARFWWHNFLGCWPLVFLLLAGVVCSFPVLLVSMDNVGKRFAWWMFQLWSRGILKAFGVRVWVRGQEHVVRGQQYVVCPNHRSHLDVPSAALALPLIMVAVYKRSLDYVPLVGQALWLSRSIGVDRRDQKDSRRQLGLVAHRFASGRSLAIFPEGTRSTGPELDTFKKGAVVVALEQQCSLLPVTILGTDVVYPPGSVMVRQGDVLIDIHPPLSAAGLGREDREDLMARLRQSITSSFVPGPVRSEQLQGARRLV